MPSTALSLLIFFSSMILPLIGCIIFSRSRKAGLLLCTAGPSVLALFFVYLAVQAASSIDRGLAVFGAVFLLLIAVCIPAVAGHNAHVKAKMDDLRQRIVKTNYIDSLHHYKQEVKSDTLDVIGRTLIGDSIAGPLGAVIGAASSEPKVTVWEEHETIFMVTYTDGTQKLDKVKNGSDIYRLYMEKLEID